MRWTVLRLVTSVRWVKNFKGCTAVITGGASGIGLAVARRLGEEGANIVIGDIDNSVALNTAPNGVKTGIGWTTFDVYESMYGGHIMHMVEFITEMKQRLEKEGQAGNYGKRQ